jgi:hypothetical protein
MHPPQTRFFSVFFLPDTDRTELSQHSDHGVGVSILASFMMLLSDVSERLHYFFSVGAAGLPRPPELGDLLSTKRRN